MGTTEELLKLLVQVKGEEELVRVAKELQNVTAATDKLAVSSEKAGSKMVGFGQSALQTGRVVQDFAQGGLGGILNNIEGLAQALGGGPGLAGALTILGVGFLVLKPQITAAAEALGLFSTEADNTRPIVERLNERIKELAEKKIKLAVDVHELDEAQKQLDTLKKAQAAFDALKESKSSAQKEAGARVTTALAETGEGEKIAGDIAAEILKELNAEETQLQKDVKTASADLAQRKKELEAAPGSTAGQGAVDAAKAELEHLIEQERLARLELPKTAGRAAGILLADASAGSKEGAAGRLADLLEKSGRGDVASKVRAATPGAVEAERLTEAGKEGAEVARKEREKIAEDNRKAAEDATNFEVDADAKLAEHARKEKAAALAKGVGQAQKNIATAQREAEKGTVDEEAAAAAARFRAQGGYTTATGKFVPLSAEGQQAALIEDVKKRLPGLSPITRGAVAGRISEKAFEDVDRQKADLQAVGTMSELQMNQAIIANTQAIFDQQLKALAGMAKTTGRELRQTNASARTLQKRFGS